MTPEAPSQIWLALAAVSLPSRNQLDALDAIEADVETDAFVDRVGIGRAVGAGDLQRNDFILEAARLGRRDRALMAVVGILVELIFGEAVFFRHHFRAGELAEHDVGITFFDSRALVMPKAVLGRKLRARPIGTLVIDSTPAAITISMLPAITACAAKCNACCDEPHWRSIEVAGTLSGSFEAITALRAMLLDCSPACITQPMITSSICAGSAPVRFHQ